MVEHIACGHEIGWRWSSVGQDGAFCRTCVRVYPVIGRPTPLGEAEIPGIGEN